jgi:alpha-L-rhamnosidase
MRQQPWYESARWIWVADDHDDAPQGKICLFRRCFTLEGDALPSGPTWLKVSADTRYRLYVNGTSVSIGPCKSYPGRWYFEEVDIQPFLHKGANVVCAVVLRFSDRYAGSLSLARTALPGLIVHCEISVSGSF